MADFLATYGIDDKALAIGLKKIEGLSSQHAQRMESTSRASVSIADSVGKGFGKGMLAVVGFGSFAGVTMTAVRYGVREVERATEEYAKVNEYTAKSLREIGYQGEYAYQRLGRNVSDLTVQWKKLKVEATSGWAEMTENIKVAFLAKTTGLDASIFRANEQLAINKENAEIEKVSADARRSLDAQRLSSDPGASARLAAATAKSEALANEQKAKFEGLLWHLRNRGLDDEASRLERSISLAAEQIVIDEKRKQLAESVSNQNRTRADLQSEKDKYAASRESTADLIEANAQRIFGLEASQRQIQIAETQLRYDKQIRDLAQDKALLEEDRARAAGLLAEQRDAELGILMAQKDAQKTGRSIAIGSSQDARQAFAPVLNEERSDRKMAQQKFDRMISELAKIRSNTGQTQVATYQ